MILTLLRFKYFPILEASIQSPSYSDSAISAGSRQPTSYIWTSEVSVAACSHWIATLRDNTAKRLIIVHTLGTVRLQTIMYSPYFF